MLNPSARAYCLATRVEAGSFPYRAVTSVPILTITFWCSHGIDRFFTDNLPRFSMRFARARAYWSENDSVPSCQLGDSASISQADSVRRLSFSD